MISIIIPTFNKIHYLDLTLASFTQQTDRDFEIVLVNDGGSEEARLVAEKYSKTLNISYIYQSNAGRAAARNTAIKNAAGDFCIFNDDDRIVTPDFVAHHRQHLLSHGDKLVVIGWKRRILSLWQQDRLPLEQSELISVLYRNPELLQALYDNPTFSLFKESDIVGDFAHVVDRFALGDGPDNHTALIERYTEQLHSFNFSWALATTANLATARDFIIGVGLFDEAYKSWGMEDTDLGYQLYRHGAQFIIERNAINFHQVHPLGNRHVLRDMSTLRKSHMRNVSYFCNKYQTVEAYLFWRILQRKLDFITANTLVQTLWELDDPAAKAELLELYGALSTQAEA